MNVKQRLITLKLIQLRWKIRALDHLRDRSNAKFRLRQQYTMHHNALFKLRERSGK